MGSPSLEALRAGLDGALGSLTWWGAASPWQGLGLVGFEVSSNPNHSVSLYLLCLKQEFDSSSLHENNLYDVHVYTLEQVFHRICGCPIPGGNKSQVGWSPGQPVLMGGSPAHGTWLELYGI